MTKILLAEDDPNLGFVIKDNLEQEGYQVVLASNGEEAWMLFQESDFDLTLIDIMMPKKDGFSLAKLIRTRSEFIPILFLTARSLEEDKLRGFEIGGDDYVTKPFSIKELLHRVRVFLRRSGKKHNAMVQNVIPLGASRFDSSNLTVFGVTHDFNLTQMEADLLSMLLEYRNQLVKREDILVRIWGENDYFKGRSLDVFVSRLRKYFKEDEQIEIRNHHGVGFTLIDHNFTG